MIITIEIKMDNVPMISMTYRHADDSCRRERGVAAGCNGDASVSELMKGTVS